MLKKRHQRNENNENNERTTSPTSIANVYNIKLSSPKKIAKLNTINKKITKPLLMINTRNNKYENNNLNYFQENNIKSLYNKNNINIQNIADEVLSKIDNDELKYYLYRIKNDNIIKIKDLIRNSQRSSYCDDHRYAYIIDNKIIKILYYNQCEKPNIKKELVNEIIMQQYAYKLFNNTLNLIKIRIPKILNYSNFINENNNDENKKYCFIIEMELANNCFPLSNYIERNISTNKCNKIIRIINFIENELKRHNIYHNDLTPGNILLNIDTLNNDIITIWIIDFGESTYYENEGKRYSENVFGKRKYICKKSFNNTNQLKFQFVKAAYNNQLNY